MPHPIPPSGDTSGPEAKMVRTLEGHRGINVNTDGSQAADQDWRRNERSATDGDLGGEYSL